MDTWLIHMRGGRPVGAQRQGPSGELLQLYRAVWTVKDLCRRSGKSRRQIYRYIFSGKIRPLGRFLGEWLIEPSALARLKPPPPSLASLLPEYDSAALDLEAARDEILSRILLRGGRERLRWAFSYYGPPSIRRFVRERGGVRLDARSLRLWCLHFRLPEPMLQPEREKGRRWGGA